MSHVCAEFSSSTASVRVQGRTAGHILYVYAAARPTSGHGDPDLHERLTTPDRHRRHSLHLLRSDNLLHNVVAEKCKAKVSKSGKLVITLQKVSRMEQWGKLRKV